MNHIELMNEAIKEAEKAYKLEEVPVGAIVVDKYGTIIGRGHNIRENKQRPSGHAEIEAMNDAAQTLNTWNLEGCTLYVTLEPCQMCAGAIMQSHVSHVIYGASEPLSGSFGSVYNINEIKGFNHYPEVTGGIEAEKCREMVVDFFKERREESVKVKKVDEALFEAYLNVRMRVFVEEQKVSKDEELDAYDVLDNPNVTHVVAIYKGEVVGTCRLLRKGTTLKIGRVAVLKDKRSLKIGSKLMRYAEVQAENNGIERMELGAQLQAIPFYERNGYTRYGDIFDDAGIDHIMMAKQIKSSN